MASTKSVRNKLPKKVALVVMVIVIVAAIALAAFYFAAPDSFRNTFPFFFDDGTPSGDTSVPPPESGIYVPSEDDTNPPDGDNTNPPSGNDTEPPLAHGEGELQVHFIDVGQGDCILILFPDGKDMLIDCANYNDSSAYRTETLNYIKSYVTDGQLDYIMLTHCDSDHVYFMDEVLEEFQVDNVFMPNVLATHDKIAEANLPQEQLNRFTDKDTVSTACYANFFIAALTEPDCNVYLNVDPDEDTNAIVLTDDGLQNSSSPDTDATYRLTFYCPTQEYYDTTDLSDAKDKNAVSPVGILEYNDFRLVLTGDSNEINEPIIAERIGKIDCDVLKVAHHGSESSSLDVFLNAVDCEYAVISCGEGNSHHHPRQVALDRLIAQDMTIYRTDNNGNIVLTVTDGDNFTFNTEKEASQEQNRDGWTDEEIKAEKEKD